VSRSWPAKTEPPEFQTLTARPVPAPGGRLF
jgi:hypothetical protein